MIMSNKEARPCDTTMTVGKEDCQVDNSTSRQEQEEKLILTAWHSIQCSLHEASKAPGPAQSFLAKQRQTTKARRAPCSPRMQPR